MCEVVREVVRVKEMKRDEDEDDEEINKDNNKKRRREECWSEIRLAIEELSLVQHNNHDYGDDHDKVSTLTFLALSNLLLQVLDKIGPTMAVLRLDIQRNIERLEDMYVLDPSTYTSMIEIVKKEVTEEKAKKNESCSKAFLWITRSMDFSAALLEKLEKDSELRLGEAVEEAYSATLKPYHGWISSAAYKVALMLVPEREIFLSFLMSNAQDCDNLKSDIKKLLLLLMPFLNQSHEILKKFQLDTLRSK